MSWTDILVYIVIPSVLFPCVVGLICLLMRMEKEHEMEVQELLMKLRKTQSDSLVLIDSMIKQEKIKQVNDNPRPKTEAMEKLFDGLTCPYCGAPYTDISTGEYCEYCGRTLWKKIK